MKRSIILVVPLLAACGRMATPPNYESLVITDVELTNKEGVCEFEFTENTVDKDGKEFPNYFCAPCGAFSVGDRISILNREKN